MNKDIAINIQNKVQYFAIRPYIDLLKKNNITYDIFVPKSDATDGFADIFEDLAFYLNKNNIKCYRKQIQSNSYKILLEPYAMDCYFHHKYKYRIKYKYSLLSAKPNPVYKPEENLCYDAILCYGPYEADFLKCYTKTFIIENLKYDNFRKHRLKKENKPVLLYLPTYGSNSSIKDVFSSLNKLTDKYEIIIKAHHGTSFLKNEHENFEYLENSSIKLFDLNTPITELLSKADVVLSDNSGSIFEAIYAKIPVAICAKNINPNLGKFDSNQYQFVKHGYIEYTNNPKKIEETIQKAMSEKSKQRLLQLRKILFGKNQYNSFITIIKMYLNENNNDRYKQLHDYFKNEYYSQKEVNKKFALQIEDLERKLETKESKIEEQVGVINNQIIKIDSLTTDLNNYRQQLKYFENGKLYKIAKKIYLLKNKMNRK